MFHITSLKNSKLKQDITTDLSELPVFNIDTIKWWQGCRATEALSFIGGNAKWYIAIVKDN